MVEEGAEHRIGHAQMEALGMSSHSTVTSSDSSRSRSHTPHTERALALRCLLAGWTAPVEGEEVARTTTAERNRLEKVASKKKSEQARL